MSKHENNHSTDHENACIDLMYPPAVAEAPNREYARILSTAYAGSVSELSATLQYSYGSFILKKTHPEIHELLESISICEMHHIAILAQLILSLGGDPQFRTSDPIAQPEWWCATPQNVSYARTAGLILKSAIESEKKAIAKYVRILNMIDDDAVRLNISRIIMDEEYHIELLSRAERKLKLKR